MEKIVTEEEFKLLKTMKRYCIVCSKCGETVSKIKKSLNQPWSDLCQNCGRKKTNLEKYGTVNNSKKQQKTCLEKYGVTSGFQTEKCVTSRKNSFNEKFENDTYFGSEKWKNDIALKAIENNSSKCSEVEWLDRDSWRGLTSKEGVIYYKFRCRICGNEFSDVFHAGKIPTCRKCHPYNHSNQENDILEFIKSVYSGSVQQNDRKVLEGKELDLYIPEFNLGIEYDGSYWHNGDHKNREKYNLKKCDIVFIKDFEWQDLTKRKIIESIIKSKLGIFENKIFARKCEIKEVSNKEYSDFCSENHLQGSSKASIKLGLFYNNELVQIESFSKPRFNRKYEWELIRECSKLGYQIIGGKEKLLKHFEKTQRPKSLLSYCDARFFNGKSYLRCGFEFKGMTIENYVYNKLHTTEVLTRYQCQKKNLKNILENYDENLTEKANMLSNSYALIYDCGNLIFEKIYY